MDIKIIEEKKNNLVLEVDGAGNGFCNALVDELWNNKDVKSAGFHVDHPLVGIPKLIVESKVSARKAFESAVKGLKKTNDSFKIYIISIWRFRKIVTPDTYHSIKS